MSDEIAVTGKPMAHYEPYVDLVAHVLANGLTLAHDREFIQSLNLNRETLIHKAVYSRIPLDRLTDEAQNDAYRRADAVLAALRATGGV